MEQTLFDRRILLIISGGIAAYKSLDLIRRLRTSGAKVRCILTEGGAQFITPLSVGALSEDHVYTDLWSLTDEQKMGHIRLSREADCILIAPASANLIAKMTQGLADDLATTVLLATDKPVFIAPAMNPMMWSNAATQENIAKLKTRGIKMIGPAKGLMACGEEGEGRFVETPEIMAAITTHFSIPGPLSGMHALVTSGPTHEPLDPVRFIGNRSSGKQGLAIARTLAMQGAQTTLITGPTHLPDPPGIKTIHVQTAQEMLAACETTLPADIAVCAAAVADWRPETMTGDKLKKNKIPLALKLVENPDILASLSKPGNRRPGLVIGFAAETSDILKHATEKLTKKGCDWLLANEVGTGKGFDQDHNQVTLLRRDSHNPEEWPMQSKENIARQLIDEIISFFNAA